MNEKFPNDMNDWSKENFDRAASIFERTVQRNYETFVNKNPNKVEKPVINRETLIGKDDLINLQILLGQAESVDDFIKNM